LSIRTTLRPRVSEEDEVTAWVLNQVTSPGIDLKGQIAQLHGPPISYWNFDEDLMLIQGRLLTEEIISQRCRLSRLFKLKPAKHT
jgi:hypothetical protein